MNELEYVYARILSFQIWFWNRYQDQKKQEGFLVGLRRIGLMLQRVGLGPILLGIYLLVPFIVFSSLSYLS